MRGATIILSLALLVASACVGCNSKAPAGCRELCSLPLERQYQTFKSFPVEQQFELYVGCVEENSCRRDSESPHDYYGQWMAEDKKAAPFLTERLKAEKDEGVQRDIIYVLRFMGVNGHLRGARHTAEVVKWAAAEMSGGDEGALKRSRGWAEEIEGYTR